MRKVGIMSMQRIANNGSFLQAYALKMLIIELGNQVEFVDFHVEPPVISDESESANRYIRKIKKGMEVILCSAPFSHKLVFIDYKQKFHQKYMPLLGVTDEMSYTPELDVLVVGSDEVFNCIQKNTNVGYSLELFGKNHKANKLISYAASFGNTTMEKLKKYGKTEEIRDCLKGFDALSVRDKNSGNIVKELSSREVTYHLDPVLVYDYMRECTLIPRIETKERYLIVYAYFQRITPEESRWIKEYAKKKGLKVYALGGIQSCADRFINCSPFEILAYFNNAEEVITDTFHGCIFSIITGRRFTALIRKSVGGSYGNEEKLTDLLERLELDNRYTYDVKDSEQINRTKIDYNAVGQILDEQRQRAKEYLKEQLSNV
ncbi:MAG: polysaccharide pyruvyl transferase family protein [Lachnospiraceae bacterium]|nr:polysaccharide pyruvyl transferase family protein [Lachnospiraceae bacterium]